MRARTVATRMKKTLNHLDSLEYRMRKRRKNHIIKIIHNRRRTIKEHLNDIEQI